MRTSSSADDDSGPGRHHNDATSCCDHNHAATGYDHAATGHHHNHPGGEQRGRRRRVTRDLSIGHFRDWRDRPPSVHPGNHVPATGSGSNHDDGPGVCAATHLRTTHNHCASCHSNADVIVVLIA